MGKALYFETLALTDYGALFDKLLSICMEGKT